MTLLSVIAAAVVTPRHVWLCDSADTVLDEVMVCRAAGGVLVTCHGGPAVRSALEAELAAAGFTSAPASVWVGRTRLESETLGLVHRAQGRLGAAMILQGAASSADALREFLAMPRDAARAVLDANDQARWLFDPPRVQLWGAVNSGKSSLLNALCGEELAAVGDEPGLTRDVIEGRFEYEGFAVRVFDAPGEMAAAKGIDRAALELAEQWKARSDLVIHLDTRNAAVPGEHWSIRSRIDETPGAEGVSVRLPGTVVALKHRITEDFIGKLLALPPGQRFALPAELRADLRQWLAGAMTADAVTSAWI